jgi:hypothetical protein
MTNEPWVTCFVCGRVAINWARLESSSQLSAVFAHKKTDGEVGDDRCWLSVDRPLVVETVSEAADRRWREQSL